MPRAILCGLCVLCGELIEAARSPSGETPPAVSLARRRGLRQGATTLYRLYDYLPSGNGYKVRLLLHQLDVPFELIELDIVKGLTRTPGFLAKNPNGRIPTLEVEPGVFLPESNAILYYLADGTPFFPTDRLAR